MRVPVFLLLAAMAGSSCADRSDPASEKALAASLALAQEVITVNNQAQVAAMEEKTRSVYQSYRAARYLPLLHGADAHCRRWSDSLQRWAEGPAEQRPTERHLSRQLTGLQDSLLALHPIIPESIGGIDFLSARTGRDSLDREWSDLDDEPVSALFLQQVRLNILSYQNKVLSILNEQVAAGSDHYHVFSALVGQNSSALLPGERLEITAGMGHFELFQKPEVRIAGKLIPLRPEGNALVSLPVPAQPGRYSVPVSIAFTDQDGKKQVVLKEVEYRVLAAQ